VLRAVGPGHSFSYTKLWHHTVLFTWLAVACFAKAACNMHHAQPYYLAHSWKMSALLLLDCPLMSQHAGGGKEEQSWAAKAVLVAPYVVVSSVGFSTHRSGA